MSGHLICQAIRTKHLLRFQYANLERLVEPHALGDDREGHLTLRGWQRSGMKPGWRNFLVSKASGFAITEETFRTAHMGYNPSDPFFVRVVCRI